MPVTGQPEVAASDLAPLFDADLRLEAGAWIGIYGGGQLGQMLAMAAKEMGYRTVTLDPAGDCPASQVSDRHITAAYDDVGAVEELADRADVITYEFENVDASALASVAGRTEVLPSVEVLRVTQDRERENGLFDRLGIPAPTYRIVEPSSSLDATADAVGRAVAELGAKCVIKSTRWGYDGKGQAVAGDPAAARQLRRDPELFAVDATVIVQEHIDFEAEISVICARDRHGRTAAFPPSRNTHVGGILDTAETPSGFGAETEAEARAMAERLATALDVVGLLCVEMFVLPDGVLLANEMAPRPHNSGHHTIEGAKTSQFEQLVRVLAGMPLGDPTLKVRSSVMANILGDAWRNDDPCLARYLEGWAVEELSPGVTLHIYGKSESRVGRKMGHVTAVADDIAQAVQLATNARVEFFGA